MTGRDAEIDSLLVNVEHLQQREDHLQRRVRDMEDRFDTLQTRWWKRLWFRLDGWPGQNDLNAKQRAWRPWH